MTIEDFCFAFGLGLIAAGALVWLLEGTPW